jgi:hypothetical protein
MLSKVLGMRIRPDIAAKVYPGFPWMKHDDWLVHREERKQRARVEIG